MNILQNKTAILSIKVRGKLLALEHPLVMGVININDDSFYSGSRNTTIDALVKQVAQMSEDGAAIIDLGVASSRPGAKLIDSDKELGILRPLLQQLCPIFPDVIFSVDTYHPKTAVAAIGEGAAIINDISAGTINKEMFRTIAELNVPYIMMHMRGVPETMQQNIQYNHVTREILDFFVQQIAAARDAGINDIIVDPGFGFGKSLHHNYELLKNLSLFQMFECPILAGLSRKSFINKLLKIEPEEALNGTSVLHTIALLNGAQILRVHDVKEAVQTVKLVQYYSGV